MTFLKHQNIKIKPTFASCLLPLASCIMTFYPELNNLNLSQLIERFQKQPLEGEDASIYYSEIALLISQQGEQGFEYLYESINSADQERLRGIIVALTESQTKTEKLRKLLIRYLDDQRPMIVAEAIDGLSKLEEKHAIDHVLVMLDHSSPYVRGSVLRFLARLYPEQALPQLLDKLKDPHFIVRENAVDELDELGIPTVVPCLDAVAHGGNPQDRAASLFKTTFVRSSS
ncbi:MAG: HEAT repeat domain-containing protein [Moorea sp. SIO1G6]|uniref:HEAT repeat domain-containing protein n=1 Tax=Moorena sp. SIO1G6 TaxID=2607840 RepID=UPI0013C1C9C5|nr:HEAT repeat domain-containing protein [Moorena sp. SIO1G6]NET65118.1 HEAT repeat domain-containing protein [Moorena sp. SIO1G6]